MSKLVAAPLAFAVVLVCGAAHAPGWTKAKPSVAADAGVAKSTGNRIRLASLTSTGATAIEVELDRAQNDAQWASWNEQNDEPALPEAGPAASGSQTGSGSGPQLASGSTGAQFGSHSVPTFGIRGSAPSGRRGHHGSNGNTPDSNSGNPNHGGSTPAGSGSEGSNTAPPNSASGSGSPPDAPPAPPKNSTPEPTPTPESNTPVPQPTPGTPPTAAPENPPKQATPETQPPHTDYPPVPPLPERPTVTVPEPGSLSLFALGLVGLMLSRRRVRGS